MTARGVLCVDPRRWRAEWKHTQGASEEPLQRPGTGAHAPEPTHPLLFDIIADRAVVEGTKAASVAGMPIGDKDETSSRKSSKKGRFNVTAASMPLNRSSVHRVPPPPSSHHHLVVSQKLAVTLRGLNCRASGCSVAAEVAVLQHACRRARCVSLCAALAVIVASVG